MAATPLMLTSCVMGYFQQPVPTHAPELTALPTFLHGEYVTLNLDLPASLQDTNPAQLLFRFEPISSTQLAISVEKTYPVSSLPLMKSLLAQAKAEGRIQDFKITNQVHYMMPAAENEEEALPQMAFIRRDRGWIRSPQWLMCSYLLDLGRHALATWDYNSFEIAVNTISGRHYTAFSDHKHLIARGKDNEVWFWEQLSENNWNLYYFKRVSDDEILLRGSLFFNANHLGALSDTTVFTVDETTGDYIFTPNDTQLNEMLRQSELFGNVHLKKLKSSKAARP